MQPLTRDTRPRGPRLRPVEVPEWNGTVYVRPLTALERLELLLGLKNKPIYL